MIGLTNIFALVLAFASAINAAIVITTTPTTINRGGSLILTLAITTGDSTLANVVFTGTGGATYALTSVAIGSTVVTLPSTIYGTVTILATATNGATSSGTGTGTMTVNTPYVPPYYPCYNPCYNPCYRPSNRCYNPCYRPSNRCNIPRPRDSRCRIRMMEEQPEQEESNILFSGFTIFPEESMDGAEQFFFEQINA